MGRPRSHQLIRAAFALGLWFALGACDKARLHTPSIPVVAPATAPARAPAPVSPSPGPEASPSAAPAQLDAEEQRMLALINQHRADHGQGPLSLNPALTDSARWLSQDMAARSYLSHTDSLGRSSFKRLDDFGFDPVPGWRGENIACGHADAAETFSQWEHSPGHDANMLSPNYSLIGIARAYDADSSYGWYWTTDFGSD